MSEYEKLREQAARQKRETLVILRAIVLMANESASAVRRGEYGPDDFEDLEAGVHLFAMALGDQARADGLVMEAADIEGAKADAAAADFRRRQAAAHSAVASAIAAGTLTRPMKCERCPAVESGIIAHHHDYDRPLDVEWLCRSCHGKHHSENGPAV